MSLIVVFTNDGTGSLDHGNYDVGVFINETQIWKGRLEGSERVGWPTQVIDLARQLQKEKDNEKS